MNTKKWILVVVVIALAAVGFAFLSKPAMSPETPNQKDLTALPADLREHIESKSDLIRIFSPDPGSEIQSPLVVTGEARGYWFFEATFPIVLVNWDGLIIAEGYATAEGDWMTEDFVFFEGHLEFEKPEYKDNGALILQRSNPSGLPENDDALEIPVKFK